MAKTKAAPKEAPKYVAPVADPETLAAKRAHGTEVTWIMKKGSTVPDRWDKKEVKILLAKPGATAEESVANVLAFCTDHVAFVDAFNAQHRLDVQKGMKDAVLTFKEGTLVDAQTFADAALSSPATRGRGEGTKVTVRQAKQAVAASKNLMEEMLAKMSPEDAEAYRQKVAALNI